MEKKEEKLAEEKKGEDPRKQRMDLRNPQYPPCKTQTLADCINCMRVTCCNFQTHIVRGGC